MSPPTDPAVASAGPGDAEPFAEWLRLSAEMTRMMAGAMLPQPSDTPGEHPFSAVLKQTHALIAEASRAALEATEGLEPAKRAQLRFAAETMLAAINPENSPVTNPVVAARALATNGESLARGMGNLLADLARGQLSHTDPHAFRLGENIAITPGKVVYETPLFQLIQYTPTTERLLATPVVIFPPWINRFYILDLNPRKSFVKWAVDAGLSVFMVSWRSADASLAEVEWDDYIAAQIDAVEQIRARLAVPAVHAIGYCVAGTTLAATLAILARRGQADHIASATFFTAQVDFADAGDLRHFVDDALLASYAALAPEGFIDGRYMAATFNLLRPQDLIWNYVRDHYWLGEDYRAFDLLHWNGDTTNLPAKWHAAYLRDLYRDNRLVVPDALSALGTPIDLTRIVTPCYIQAGREDHIAPAGSVWRLTRHLRAAPWRFVLAGSGHIAGVVNPPAAGKYQYWTNPAAADTLADFIAGAEEHAGSWWPDWLVWLDSLGSETVKARGRRVPGKGKDRVIEDAPGRYVAMR